MSTQPPPTPHTTFATEQDEMLDRIRSLYNTLIEDFSLPDQLRGNEMMLDCQTHLYYAERSFQLSRSNLANADSRVNQVLFDLHLDDLLSTRYLVRSIEAELELLKQSVEQAQQAGELVSSQLFGEDGVPLNEGGVMYDTYEYSPGTDTEVKEERGGFGGLREVLVMAGLACGLALFAYLPFLQG